MRDGDDMAPDRLAVLPDTAHPLTGPVASEEWEPVTEVELAALALAADPNARLDDDAVPIDDYLGTQPSLLPLWYMPRPLARPGSRWRLAVVVAVVGAFLVIEALGLCSTFGHITIG